MTEAMRSTGVRSVGSTRPLLRSCLVPALTVSLATSVATQTPPPPSLPSGQSEQSLPTFRASVRYVEVDVDVKVRGQFLAGLTKDDFELYENRQRQVSDRVTFVDIPAVSGPDDEPPERPAREQAEVIASPQFDDGFNLTGRVYAMVLGQPPPSSSRGATWAGLPGDEGVKALARKFIQEYLGPDDLLAIVHATTPTRGQGLTSDKERLLAAVDRYRTSDFPPPPDRYLYSSLYRPPLVREDPFSRLYRTVKEVAVSLGSITGRRKSIILVSEGEDLWAQRWDIHDRWAYVRDATRTAAAFNVPIHTIRPRGMVVPLMVDGENSGPLPFRFADTGTESGRRLLSEETNGLDLGTVTSADKGFSRVVAQNTRYYILGYYSSLERDGKNHSITVRVRRDGAAVNARRGVRALRPIQMPRAVDLPRALSPRLAARCSARKSPRRSPSPRRLTCFTAATSGRRCSSRRPWTAWTSTCHPAGSSSSRWPPSITRASSGRSTAARSRCTCAMRPVPAWHGTPWRSSRDWISRQGITPSGCRRTSPGGAPGSSRARSAFPTSPSAR